ncbi:hypothetical protein FHY52_15480, partial [Nocardia nova]|nr:hypothetical protein [Nocardia nova]
MAVSAESAAAETITLADGVRSVLAATLETELTDVVLRQFTGGASRQVYAIEARDGTGTAVRAVLRRDPPGHGDPA